jgi:hypothetical protein
LDEAQLQSNRGNYFFVENRFRRKPKMKKMSTSR